MYVYVYDEPIISEIGTFHAYNRGINDPYVRTSYHVQMSHLYLSRN